MTAKLDRVIKTPWGNVNRRAAMQTMTEQRRHYLHSLLRKRLDAHSTGNAARLELVNDRIARARHDIGTWERQGL